MSLCDRERAATEYALLSAGCSMGDKYGPMIVARKRMTPKDLPGVKIAVPGTLTTAFNYFAKSFPTLVQRLGQMTVAGGVGKMTKLAQGFPTLFWLPSPSGGTSRPVQTQRVWGRWVWPFRRTPFCGVAFALLHVPYDPCARQRATCCVPRLNLIYCSCSA